MKRLGQSYAQREFAPRAHVVRGGSGVRLVGRGNASRVAGSRNCRASVGAGRGLGSGSWREGHARCAQRLPYNGRYLDRIDRALATGVPVAIEQDLVWRPAGEGRPARSIVSHGEPYDGKEPSLREYFFERIRPIVEQALKSGDRAGWPLVTLNLDLKSNEPEHHRAIWTLLGEYESWLTTAERTADGGRRRAARRQTGTRVNGRSRYAGTHVPQRGTCRRKIAVVRSDSAASAGRRRHEPRREPREVPR